MKLFKEYIPLFIVGIVLIIFYNIFSLKAIGNILKAFNPVIIGAVLAYFLSPLVSLLEQKLPDNRHRHWIASLLVFFSFIIVVAILITYIVPIIISSVASMANSLNGYFKAFDTTVHQIIPNANLANRIVEFEKNLIKSVSNLQGINFDLIATSIGSASSVAMQTLLGLIFCPYILIESSRLTKIGDRILLIFMNKKQLDYIHYYLKTSNKIFGEFIYGKFIDSVIIGIIAFIGLYVLKIQYFPILAFIIFITNMIPYFGPFIGGVPVALVALLTGGVIPGISTALFIFALQQFDGLLLGPKILGDTVGISPFWIILSITIFGNFFGFIGMFLGVPIICIIRVLFNDYVKYKEKGVSPLD